MRCCRDGARRFQRGKVSKVLVVAVGCSASDFASRPMRDVVNEGISSAAAERHFAVDYHRDASTIALWRRLMASDQKLS